ncbi:MAG: hypothetical protein BroJett031_08320 [Betaproteobacteria bacterium]|nr:MAG: hypothetical protein BroJett031_08320 [Betaproteobacteria bacterium]
MHLHREQLAPARRTRVAQAACEIQQHGRITPAAVGDHERAVTPSCALSPPKGRIRALRGERAAQHIEQFLLERISFRGSFP